MLRVLFAASLVALLTGCAHKPELAGTPKPQVNRAMKSDKLPVKQPDTPNKVVKRRFCDGFMARWCSHK